MSSMLCRCDNVIYDNEIPSKVWILAYRKSDVDAYLEVNPSYRLKDLYMDYELGYELWRCRHCHRIYMFPDGSNRWEKVYSISYELPKVSWDEIQKLSEYYFFSDVQFTKPLNDEEFLLRAFLADPPHSYRFFVSEDETVVYAYNNATKQLEFVYKYEDGAKHILNKS